MHRHRTIATIVAAAALIAPAAAQAQDLRSPDAVDAARPTVIQTTPGQDLRSPDTRDIATRPMPPDVVPAPEPVSHHDGSPVPVVPIVAGALLVLLAALIARYTARRTGRSTRVAV